MNKITRIIIIHFLIIMHEMLSEPRGNKEKIRPGGGCYRGLATEDMSSVAGDYYMNQDLARRASDSRRGSISGPKGLP